MIGFTLPTLAVGETIDAATFSITISSTNNGAGTVNVSLFGLATTNPDGTGTSLYSTNGTGAIDSTFTNTNAAPGVIPSADVSNFILSLYTGNMPSQTEAFFRLNLNSDPFPSINRATFTNGTAQLSLNVVSTAPEPSRAVLLLFGAAGLFLRRRRK